MEGQAKKRVQTKRKTRAAAPAACVAVAGHGAGAQPPLPFPSELIVCVLDYVSASDLCQGKHSRCLQADLTQLSLTSSWFYTFLAEEPSVWKHKYSLEAPTYIATPTDSSKSGWDWKMAFYNELKCCDIKLQCRYLLKAIEAVRKQGSADPKIFPSSAVDVKPLIAALKSGNEETIEKEYLNVCEKGGAAHFILVFLGELSPRLLTSAAPGRVYRMLVEFSRKCQFICDEATVLQCKNVLSEVDWIHESRRQVFYSLVRCLRAVSSSSRLCILKLAEVFAPNLADPSHYGKDMREMLNSITVIRNGIGWMVLYSDVVCAEYESLAAQQGIWGP